MSGYLKHVQLHFKQELTLSVKLNKENLKTHLILIFSRGKRHPKRWYAASTTGVKTGIDSNQWAGFDTTMPAEWESWLRNRRARPPTEVNSF